MWTTCPGQVATTCFGLGQGRRRLSPGRGQEAVEFFIFSICGGRVVMGGVHAAHSPVKSWAPALALRLSYVVAPSRTPLLPSVLPRDPTDQVAVTSRVH